jgi:hypothetical protein
MVTHIIFPSKAVADALLYEIAVTPMVDGQGSPVWVWWNPDNPVKNDISYATSQDGRVAIAHPFDDVALTWLTAYLDGQAGVQILDALPSDWRYPLP